MRKLHGPEEPATTPGDHPFAAKLPGCGRYAHLDRVQLSKSASAIWRSSTVTGGRRNEVPFRMTDSDYGSQPALCLVSGQRGTGFFTSAATKPVAQRESRLNGFDRVHDPCERRVRIHHTRNLLLPC